MITRTKEEVEEFVRRLWRNSPPGPDDYHFLSSHFEVKATLLETGEVRITISDMYDPPGLKVSHLFALAEFFGTKNINDDDRFNYSGCETCDYGSCYGFTLTVRPEKPIDKAR